MPTSALPRTVLALAVALALCGLTPDLAASAGRTAAACPDLSGDWDSGSWTSATTGHTGKLRATLTRCGANRYRCTFCGTFWKVVPFRYTVPLHVTGCRDGVVYFRASKTLPLCGGTFTCSGCATSRTLRANFSAQDDRGTFVMSR
ncbi:MAG TPA: hypothetical protein VF170_06620 [Planctomycetaceae bacterium]